MIEPCTNVSLQTMLQFGLSACLIWHGLLKDTAVFLQANFLPIPRRDGRLPATGPEA